MSVKVWCEYGGMLSKSQSRCGAKLLSIQRMLIGFYYIKMVGKYINLNKLK